MKTRYNTILLTMLLVIMAPVAALAITFPHDYTNGYGCGVCHKSQQSLGLTGYSNLCTACHNPNDPKGSKFPFYQADAASPYGIILSRYSGGIIPRKLYQTSHNWTGSDINPQAGAQAPIRPSMNATATIKGYLLCSRCHSVHGPRSSWLNSAPFLRDFNDNDQMCRDCHTVRDTTSHLSGSHPININYTSATSQVKLKPSKYYPAPVNANPANPTSAMKLINGKVLCSTCHGVHYTDSNSGTVDGSATYSTLSTSKGYLLRTDARGKTADAVNICTNCHAGKGAHNAKNQNIQCNDCHSAHVEYDPTPNQPLDEQIKNKFLVRRFMNVSTQYGAIRNERTFFRYTGATSKEFYIGNAGMKGVCQSCHYETVSFAKRHYIGGLAVNGLKSDYDTTKCNTCHNHQNNFSASGAPLDSVPPIITPTITGTLVNGWYTGKVTVVLTATDETSGVKTISYAIDGDPETVIPGADATFDLISDGTHTVAYGATDNSDNPATGSIALPIDTTPPNFTQIVLPQPNANGWYNKDVTVHFIATDALSGLAGVIPDTVVSIEGAGQTATGTAVDVAGNSSSYTMTGINVDKTAPTIMVTFSGAPLVITPPPQYPTYQLGLAEPTFTSNDVLSGIAGTPVGVKTGTPDDFGGGTFTYSVTATDNAGNTTTSSVTYVVKATPQGTINLINTLVGAGAIPSQPPHDTADTLLATLAKALSDYSSSDIKQGGNMMNTFQNLVNAALNSGNISAATESLLLNAANSIIANQGN